MKKIYIFVGVVIILCFFIGYLFLFSNIVNLSRIFEDKTKDIDLGEKGKFIGRWIVEQDDSIYNFKSDGSFTHRDIQGTYKINNDSIITFVYYDSGKQIVLDLNYAFSDNDNLLSLVDLENIQDIKTLDKILS